MMKSIVWLSGLTALLSLFISLPAAAQQAMPREYQQVLTILGKQGDFQDQVLVIPMPRADIQQTIMNIPVPPAFGFSGALSFTKGDGGIDVLLGELVLQAAEVNPVASALLKNHFQISALHNHFLTDQPRIFFLHLQGVGKATEQANRLKPALALLEHPAVAAPTPPAGELDTANLDRIVKHKGAMQAGTVWKYAIERSDIRLSMYGARISGRMGLGIVGQFYGTNTQAYLAGEMALLPTQLAPVENAVRQYGLDLSAVNNHMINTKPEIIFVHFEASGTANQLANAFRAALSAAGVK